ncbi:N-formylglutamate amidohydrolase [Arenimonas sp.]|uniref:N-formylglutamate amidohydrolase n=1 Tax=Arenimonas sp. TaxID=1872635 RepID=UPI0035B47115
MLNPDTKNELAAENSLHPDPDAGSGDWHILSRPGPVLATAIHDGHGIRPSLLPYLAISDADRRREEDPLTGVLCTVGDTAVQVRSSRFAYDLNRPRAKAISTDPADTWGLKIWRDDLPASEVDASLARYDRFYQDITRLIEQRLERWGSLLLLDIHSYNHRRDGAGAPAADAAGNPDIDLGVTTLDPARWGDMVADFTAVLSRSQAGNPAPDVRRNIRYPTGGHFPEWVYARYGSDVCTISLEYKKIFMDEWTSQADLAELEGLRTGLERAVAAIRGRWGRV